MFHGVGGVELLLTRLVEWTKGRGIRHSAACLQGEAEFAKRFDDSVEVHRLRSHPNDIRLPWRLLRLLRALDNTKTEELEAES